MIEALVVRALDRVFELAEGPVWDPARNRVLWVDILAGAWFEGEIHDQEIRIVDEHRDVDRFAAAVFPTAAGGRVVAGHHRLWLEGGGTRKPGPLLLDPRDFSRINDCAVDPRGRMLVGSVATDGRQRHDLLERLEFDGSVTILDNDLSCSNGLAWSEDGSLLYSTDSRGHTIYSRPYNASTGLVGARQVHVDFGQQIPDGICLDREGHLWVAIWGAGEVRRYTPSGELNASIAIPVPQTSSVAFVGPELDLLLITTARENLSLATLHRYPHSGSLYLTRPGVQGLATTPWRGNATVVSAKSKTVDSDDKRRRGERA